MSGSVAVRGHVLALSGGVGGAKLAAGLVNILPPDQLTIAVNTGDDFEHLGLTICPDIDSVVYALAGLFCAIAGWVMIGRFGSVSPSASTGQLGNIQSITAVVIGGISLFGGRGSIVGMFFGALIVGVFEMGLRLVGTDPQWTFFLIGVLIIFAVAVDQWIRKVSG